MTLSIDYQSWKQLYAPILKTFTAKTIFVLYSGGKDSSVVLHLLDQARREFDFNFQVHAGAFPHHRYTQTEVDRLTNYWHARNVDIKWHAVKAADSEISERADPCAKCRQIRKNLLQNYLFKVAPPWPQVVLVISYSLWDLVSYAVEHVLEGVFAVSNATEGVNQRFLEIAQRFYPLLEMQEGYQVFRPLLQYNDQEIEASLDMAQIPSLAIPCAHKSHRPKRVLSRYYAARELRFDYEQVLAFARDALGLPDKSFYKGLSKKDYLGRVF